MLPVDIAELKFARAESISGSSRLVDTLVCGNTFFKIGWLGLLGLILTFAFALLSFGGFEAMADQTYSLRSRSHLMPRNSKPGS
jgi:hypothetical protein